MVSKVSRQTSSRTAEGALDHPCPKCFRDEGGVLKMSCRASKKGASRTQRVPNGHVRAGAQSIGFSLNRPARPGTSVFRECPLTGWVVSCIVETNAGHEARRPAPLTTSASVSRTLVASVFMGRDPRGIVASMIGEGAESLELLWRQGEGDLLVGCRYTETGLFGAKIIP